jgi:hypothetical protein
MLFNTEFILAKAALQSAALLILLASSPKLQASAYSPCDREYHYEDVIDKTISAKAPGAEVIGFTQYPSFTNEWGIRIFKTDAGYVLRSVNFHDSVWYSAYQEVEPNSFGRIPSEANYHRSIREVKISHDFVSLLEAELIQESKITEQGAFLGFDGVSNELVVNGKCFEASSTNEQNRQQRIFLLFDDMLVQTYLPSRLLQYFYERQTYYKLQLLAGQKDQTMQTLLMIVGAGILVALVTIIPILFSILVSFIPSRLQSKIKFIYSCLVRVYGTTCLIALPLLPFALAYPWVAAWLSMENYSVLADVLIFVGKWSPLLIFTYWLFASLVIPVRLRKKWKVKMGQRRSPDEMKWNPG